MGKPKTSRSAPPTAARKQQPVLEDRLWMARVQTAKRRVFRWLRMGRRRILRGPVRRMLITTRTLERKLETLDGDINLHRSVHVPLILRDSLRIAKAIPRKEWPPPPHDTGHTQSD